MSYDVPKDSPISKGFGTEVLKLHLYFYPGLSSNCSFPPLFSVFPAQPLVSLVIVRSVISAVLFGPHIRNQGCCLLLAFLTISSPHSGKEVRRSLSEGGALGTKEALGLA